MTTLDYVLLSVENPRRSGAFYSKLLNAQPVQDTPTFVLFALPNGIKLGLWINTEMEPKPLPAGGFEVSFSEDNEVAVRATHAAWKQHGASIVQEPVKMDFGFTFVASDPDGHRLRVFSPAADPR